MLRYELKQMLGKVFKPQVKPREDTNLAKCSAPCGHCGDSRWRLEEISEFVDLYPDKWDKYKSSRKMKHF